MLSYLFLSFLNESCSRKQHARFLPPLFIITNVSLLLSAFVTTAFFNIRQKLNFNQNKLFMAGIFYLEGVLSLLLLFCKYILERKVMVTPIFRNNENGITAVDNTVIDIGQYDENKNESIENENNQNESIENENKNESIESENINKSNQSNGSNKITNQNNEITNQNTNQNNEIIDESNENSQNITEQPVNNNQTKSNKPKNDIGFSEGLKIMAHSKFLLAMSTIVFCFSALFNILETVFKNGIKKGAIYYNKEPGKYSGMYNNIDQYATAIGVIILNLSSFSNLIESKGWFIVAVITPIIAGISATVILGIASYNAAAVDGSISHVNKLFNSIFGTPLPNIAMENMIGMICLCAMKIFKFTAFDVSKEKISMRIENRYRPKFKSIFDGIFNKFGKSFGAFYGIVVNSLVSSIDIRGMSPITSFIAASFIISWFVSVYYLNNSYVTSIENNENVNIDIGDYEENNTQADIKKNEELQGLKNKEMKAVKVNE